MSKIRQKATIKYRFYQERINLQRSTAIMPRLVLMHVPG